VSAPLETDLRRLEQRAKQIALGYATPAYQRYLALVPKQARNQARKFEEHPLTPRKEIACSKRAFDGQMKKWRRLLHQYDEDGTEGTAADGNNAVPAATTPAPSSLTNGATADMRKKAEPTTLVFAPSLPAKPVNTAAAQRRVVPPAPSAVQLSAYKGQLQSKR
jgi:histone RNA hairpin-binding protein